MSSSDINGYLRFVVSFPRQANEHVWARSPEEAQKLALSLYNAKEGVLVRSTCKYEFAMKIGAANIRTFGNNLEEVIRNLITIGFVGTHDIVEEVTKEFYRQESLILIKIYEDKAKLDRIKNK